MKATKKAIPALLGDSQQPSLWRLHAKTRSDEILMTFTSRAMADQEFRRIKTQGTVGGQWLTDITLEEVKQDDSTE